MDQLLFRALLAVTLAALVSSQSVCKLDIALAIDTSGSIAVDAASGGSVENWNNVSAFLVELVQSFDVGAEKAKIGAVTFASNAKVEFNLNEYSNNAALKTAVEAITYPPGGGTTNTQQALELIRDDIFNSANGDRDNADNFVFLITDGKPNPFNMNSLNNVVTQLKAQDNPTIIGVAVGPAVDYDVMESITDQYINVTNFQGLSNIVSDIVGRACPAEPDTCPEPIPNMYMFSALYRHGGDHRMELHDDMVIPFGHVLTNVGGAYDRDDSTFVCPCDGYYQFTATMSDVSNMGVVIMRDDDVVSAMGYEKNEGHISANTIIACLTGQRVYVQLAINHLRQNYLQCNFNDDMVLGGFSGHLLNTMEL